MVSVRDVGFVGACPSHLRQYIVPVVATALNQAGVVTLELEFSPALLYVGVGVRLPAVCVTAVSRGYPVGVHPVVSPSAGQILHFESPDAQAAVSVAVHETAVFPYQAAFVSWKNIYINDRDTEIKRVFFIEEKIE